MTQKHTPGPWSYTRNIMDTRWIIDDGDGRGIAVTGGYEPDNEDNARLIAAAPDLLEALEAAVECGMVPNSSAREGGAVKYARQAIVADMIRDAIAKAEGR